MEFLYVILATLICFLALIMVIAAKPKFTAKVTRIIFAIVGVTGLFFYGYGFMVTTGNFCLSVIRSLLAVCGMYMGAKDWGSISTAPLMQFDWMQVLFWVVHLFALYATASAAITTVGGEALRKLRLWLARRGALHLIYGANDDTIALAKQLLQEKNGAVVFVDESADVSEAAAVAKAGCVLRWDAEAAQGGEQFLKSIGATRGGRKITLYAMKDTASDNLRYAQKLLRGMEAGKIVPEQTRLVIRCRENTTAVGLQVLGDAYGYGSVTVIQETDLVARTLVRNYPPCNHLAFNENGKACEDFEAVIIGFGQVGQTVLRHLVMNGQFEGSTFRAAVFSPDCNSVKGYFTKSYAQVLQQYDISFRACDARSEEVYDYLQERGSRVKYLAICTGSDRLNQEIAEDLTEYLSQHNVAMSAYLCSHRGVKCFDPMTGTVKSHSLYRVDMLSMEKMDALAMCVNSHYQQDQEKTPLEHWLRCDYFSRMSCRAVADFIPAMLKMVNKTRAQVMESGWDLTPAQLETLSKTEHLRWCAFHYSMGFSPMTREEYDCRTETYRRQLAAGEKPLRIGKNMVARTHACLIGWEELAELSERENRITGKSVDYQAMDTENVLIVPELLRAGEKTKA